MQELDILTKAMNLRTELDKFLDSEDCSTFRAEVAIELEEKIEACFEMLRKLEKGN